MLIATIVGSKALSTGDLAAASASVGACGTVRWLEEGRAAEFHFQTTERNEASLALEQALPHADVFVQPVAERGKKLFVADMDSTMIDAECIDELADYANLKAEISAVTEAAMRGEIDFAGALTRRVALLKGLSETAIAACLRDRVRPTPGAKTLVATLKAQGIRTVLVSGGFTHFTGPVAADIGFDMAVANTLELAGNTLTGRVAPPIVGPETKAATLRS
jgi:phosphoserine phosphatase